MITMSARLTLLVLFSLLFLSACEPSANWLEASIADYKSAREVFWQELYPDTSETLYCGSKVHSDQRRGVNIEHVFPMSWATNGLNCGTRKQCRQSSSMFNLIEADLHNLYPALTEVNASRSSFRFGEIKGERRSFGAECDFEVDQRRRMAEPRPAVRGEIARAMFYMAWQYQDQGLTIFSRSGKILQEWHNADRPTQQERRRNDRIERLQGKRNHFIDDPERLNQLIAEGFFY